MTRTMNHNGFRGVEVRGSRAFYTTTVEVTANVYAGPAPDPEIGITLKGPRGGTHATLRLTDIEADELAAGLTWVVAQRRGFGLNTRAQGVRCQHGDEHGHAGDPPEDEGYPKDLPRRRRIA